MPWNVNRTTIERALALLFFGGALVLILAGSCHAGADELVREGRYTLVDDQGQTLSVHNELHVAIVRGQDWSRDHDGRTFRIHPPAYRGSSSPAVGQPAPPEPVDPPDTPDLPERVERAPVKNQDASDFVIDRPTRVVDGKVVPTAGAWFDVWDRRDELLPFALSNGIIRGYGGEGGNWGHGIYAHHATLTIDDLWIYGPTRLEQLGRDHPIYLSGSPLTASRLLIGHPDDEHPHTISLNITRGDNGPQPCDIDTLVVIGGRRVVIEVDDDALSRLRIGRLFVIGPVTADGLWEGIEIEGCPDVSIGEYVVIDTAGRWNSGALVKARDCAGEVGRAAIYAPNAPPSDTLIRGLDGSVERLATPPAGDPPDVSGPESIDALIAWANAASPVPSTPAKVPPLRLYTEAQLADALAGMGRLAAAELAAEDRNDASVTLEVLRHLIDTIAAAQAISSGGVPERINGGSTPHDRNVHHSDSGTTQAVIGLLELAAISEETGGKMARVLPPDELRAMAALVLDNAAVSVRVLGGLPGQTDPADPTRPAKERGFQPRDVFDTIAESAMLNACRHWHLQTGEAHALEPLLIDVWSRRRAAWPGTMPRYLSIDTGRAVYGTADGEDTEDITRAKADYLWEHDGSRGDRQVGLLEALR